MEERSGYLANGMRWLIDGVEAPVVAIYLWIDVGSRDEAEGMEGAAHALEHMVFKGTAPPEGARGVVGAGYGVGGVAAAVEGAGGDINAWTSYDETVYHLTVPPEEAGLGLSVLAQMLRYATLDAGEFKREKEVICEEIRGGEEEPDHVLGEALYAGLFPGHAYGRPIAGTAAGVRRLTAAGLRAFYDRFYQPSNCCIALSGPVGRTEAEAAEVVAGLEARFGGGGPRPERAVRAPEPAAGSLTVRRDFPGEWREIAFPGPGHRHPDTAALELLGEMIGGSASAPMEGLRRELHLCQSVSARYEAEQQAGLFTVYLQTAPGGGAAAQRAAGAMLGALVDGAAGGLAGGLSQADLERAQAQLLAERAFSRETADGRAHSLVFHDRVMGDPHAWRAYDREIAGLGLAEVQAAARRWLRPERSLQVFLAPKPGKPLPLVYGEAAEVRGLLPALRAGGAGEVERWHLGNGLEVLLEPAESEVVGVRVAGAGGQIAGWTPGWTELWSRLVLRGPGGMEARRFAAEVERTGASMGATTGRSTQGMSLDVPARGLDAALELLALGLAEPTFPADGLAVVRAEQDRAREEEEDYPETVVERACWAMAFLRHPWGRPPRGTAAGLARATPAGLLRLHRRWARAGNLKVAIAGSFDPERVKLRLERLLGRLPAGRAEIRLPPAPDRAGGERRWSMEAGQGQAQLAMVFPGCAAADPARPLLQPALSTVAAVLGGQGGRLFMELRERRGLAYDVGASSEEGLAPGLLICSLGIEPGRMAEAEAALRRCVAELVEGGVPAEELQRAIRSQIGAGASDLQTMAGRARAAAYTAVYGEDGTQHRRLMRRVEQVDDTALRAALDLLRRPVGVVQVMPRDI